MFIVVALGFAVHVLLPQVSELQQGLQALRSGRWPSLLLSVTGSGLTYLAGAWMARVSVDRPPGWARTILVQVAASVASILTAGWWSTRAISLKRR